MVKNPSQHDCSLTSSRLSVVTSDFTTEHDALTVGRRRLTFHRRLVFCSNCQSELLIESFLEYFSGSAQGNLRETC